MKLLIAGGGTGGHLFPGIAVAEEWRTRFPNGDVHFVGTRRGIEARVLPETDYDHSFIEVSGMKTVGLASALKGLLSVPKALWQSRRLIMKFRPDVVVGVGGYASGPAVLAARLMGLPTAIIEQNSVPGLANRILGKVVRAVFLSFDYTRSYFAAKKCVMSGNPIRQNIRKLLEEGARPPNPKPRVFVFGGSQGAVAVNDLCVEMFAMLAAEGIELSIIHQAGKRDIERITSRYQELGLTADCRAFIQDMAAEYARADIVIARSGATTVAELGVVGVPAILIPYPFAADNHQELNAAEMAATGAAILCRQADLTAEKLASEVRTLISDSDALSRMGSAMKALGKPQAARDIVNWCATVTGN